jgi:hypothetical protein
MVCSSSGVKFRNPAEAAAREVLTLYITLCPFLLFR